MPATNLTLTITQALQLVGLVPSLFVALFLLTLLKRNPQVVVPAFYFLSLACSFALPLLALSPPLARDARVIAALLLGESMLVALCFLLVVQFLMGRMPPASYWLVLAIPLVGGSSLIYAGILQPGEVCMSDTACYDISSVETLYNVFASAFIFLLLVYYSSRLSGMSGDEAHRRHKYWLIVALILLHLFVLALDLARLSGHVTPGESHFVATIFRLSFIYLVITSLFRVFYPALAAEPIHFPTPYVRAYHPELDKPHAEKILALLEGEKVYREMRLNRAALAEKVGIGEHHLSRVINGHFGKNFSELINGYRIEEAKRRLREEPDQQITSIAFETGFNSIASFNRVFKEKVGVSPTEYRGINTR